LNEGEEVEELGVVVVEKELSGDDKKRRDRMRRRARREAEEAAMDARREERRSRAEGREEAGRNRRLVDGGKPSAKPSCHGSGGRGRCMGRTVSPRWAGLYHLGTLLWKRIYILKASPILPHQFVQIKRDEPTTVPSCMFLLPSSSEFSPVPKANT
jgi:hypothetical protein